MAFFKFFSAIFTRVLFLVHGFFSVYLVVESQNNNPIYYWLCTGLVLLVFESCYTIIYRKGEEYKYFWPGSLLYMATVLAAIWVAELAILRERQADPEKECLVKGTDQAKFSVDGFITIKADSDSLAQKFSKLGLILVIIIARWLLPRGELTRDQLSTLLLVYVANAADIMELFEVFDSEPKLWCIPGVAEAVLATYTWCFMQFTLVFTATAHTVPDEKKAIAALVQKDALSQEEEKLPKYIRKLIRQKRLKELKAAKGTGDMKKQPKYLKSSRGKGRYEISNTVTKVVHLQREVKREEEILEEQIKEKEKLRFHGDLYSILTLMLMQDGPFLVVRLYLSFGLGVVNEMHIFFAGKNAMALCLLMYRLIILLFESKQDEEDQENTDGLYGKYTPTTRTANSTV